MPTLIRIRAADGTVETFKNTALGLRDAQVRAQEIANAVGDKVKIELISGNRSVGEARRKHRRKSRSTKECCAEAAKVGACECECGKQVGGRKSKAAERAEACPPIPLKPKMTRGKRKRLAKQGRCAIVETTKTGKKKCHYPLDTPNQARLALQALTRVAGRHGPDPTNARKVLKAVKQEFPKVYKCYPDLVANAKARHRV